MLQILYKKKNDTEYDIKYKNARIHPRFTLPVELTDSWNGKNIIVQVVQYDSYYVEFIAENDEMNDIINIMTADNLIIRDTIQNLEYTADRTVQESILFNEPENIPPGNSWKISFIFKTKRHVVSKALPVLNTNTLICSYEDDTGIETKTFYTDYDIFDDTKDTDSESTSNKDGVKVLDYALTQRAYRCLFYLAPIDASDLKEFFEKSQTITLNGITILQNDIVTMEPYGENLYKLQFTCLTSSEVSFPSVF